jgi:DNA polymerase I
VTGKDTFLMIDASGLLYRSFFALPPLTSPSGEPTGALFGFIRSILKVHQKVGSVLVVAVFDGPENKKSRLSLYPEYKATRKPTPSELIFQIGEAKKFCSLWGIPFLSQPGVEADDTIASVASWAQKELPVPIYICTADKDLAQLVNDKVKLINPAKDDKISDEETVLSDIGLPPSKLIDYYALIGDASDNVPGIDGIGPKTALELLTQWGSLDNLLDHAHEISGKKGERIQQGKEIALLSRKLVTLDHSVDIPKDRTFYLHKPSDFPALHTFFQEKGFKTLDSLLASPNPSPELRPCTHEIVRTKNEFDHFLQWLKKQKNVALDCETTSIDEYSAELVGIGVGAEPAFVYYIDCRNEIPAKSIVEAINTVLHENHIGLIGHNIKYDLHVLSRYGLAMPKLDFDTLIASWLLNSHERNHNLDDLSRRHFNKEKIPIESLIGKGKTARTMAEAPVEEAARYCAEDVEYTLRLKALFEPQLKETHVNTLFHHVEMPLIPILFRMENWGVYINVEHLQVLKESIDRSLNELETDVYAMAGKEFNINSPKQLSEVLFSDLKLPKQRKGKQHLSTNADVMEELSLFHPIAQKILEYRQLEKLRSTYLETLPKQIRADGRVHCRFIQSGTATGRLSCQDPNLQNIPVRTELGKEIRAAFEPQSPGWVYVSADYSQIELRLLAHLSQDPVLVKSFNEEIDIHAMTASELFSVPLDKVTEEMRRKAKAVNFGVIYGQQAFGLARELRISTKEAQKFIDFYFARYKKVQSVLEQAKQKAHETGMAETLTGRRRLLPDINAQDFIVRSAQERLAVNTPFQGTAADMIKRAMISLDSWLAHHKLQTKMVLQIHDELLFEAPESELDLLLPTVRTMMESAMELIVPLRVEISVGKNWKEC